MLPLGLYVHWPFCVSKCPYCDFNSHVRAQIDEKAWRDAYLKELAFFHERTEGRTIQTIFFGGGTPSLMDPSTTAAVIDFIRSHWPCGPDLEVTLEANPQSSDQSRFLAFREAGINRLSLGIQSLHEDVLRHLGRAHSPHEAIKAIEAARTIFDRYSFDLITTHPWHTRKTWRQELLYALSLAQGHLSLYQLTIEKGTPFYLAFQRGDLKLPDEDESARFYEETLSAMADHGYHAYEVSNYAQPSQESRHNLIYWRYQDYIGVGPGAHGRLTQGGGKVAMRQHRAPEEWLRRVNKNGVGLKEEIRLTPQDMMRECLLMGLRLSEGMPWERLDAYGSLDESKLEALTHEGYIMVDTKTIYLTPDGRLRLSAILDYLAT